MSTKQLSQTALYGELLTSVQQYHQEISQFVPLSDEQKQALIERARAGEQQAGHDLVCSLLPSVFLLAIRYAQIARRTEIGDFCQAASIAMLEALERALEKKNPYAYLYGVARLTMQQCYGLHDELIEKKSHQDYEKENYVTLSLDVPLHSTGEQTWEDVLEAPALILDGETKTAKEHEPLYQALDALTDKQRIVILRCHGLCGYPQSTLVEIEYDLTGKVSKNGQAPNVVKRKQRAMDALKKSLVCA
jgi:DNA-directed RNA polymerase sigma subunit (sigma70/sigma32)